jgi:hypothetical protein
MILPYIVIARRPKASEANPDCFGAEVPRNDEWFNGAVITTARDETGSNLLNIFTTYPL